MQSSVIIFTTFFTQVSSDEGQMRFTIICELSQIIVRVGLGLTTFCSRLVTNSWLWSAPSTSFHRRRRIIHPIIFCWQDWSHAYLACLPLINSFKHAISHYHAMLWHENWISLVYRTATMRIPFKVMSPHMPESSPVNTTMTSPGNLPTLPTFFQNLREAAKEPMQNSTIKKV